MKTLIRWFWLKTVPYITQGCPTWLYRLEVRLFDYYCRLEYPVIYRNHPEAWRQAFRRNSYLMMDNLGIDVRLRPSAFKNWGRFVKDYHDYSRPD